MKHFFTVTTGSFARTSLSRLLAGLGLLAAVGSSPVGATPGRALPKLLGPAPAARPSQPLAPGGRAGWGSKVLTPGGSLRTAAANDGAVTSLYTLAQLPATYGQHAVRAIVTNAGTTTLTSLPVTLTVSGALTFADVQTVATLAPGATTLVTFAAYTAPATAGTATVAVSVPADDNTANNTLSQSQAITNGVFGYAPAGTATNTGASLGGAGDTRPVVRAVRFRSSRLAQVTGLNNYVVNSPYNTGKVIYGVVMNATGTVLARTPDYTIQSADLNTYKRLTFTTPPTVSGDFFLGIGGDLSAFPTAYAPENPVRPSSFYSQQHLPDGGPLPEAVANPSALAGTTGLQLIEALVAAPAACASPGNLLAGSITGTTAQLSFEAAPGTTGFVVTYQVQGSSAVTTVNATSSPVTLTGLTPGTTYLATVAAQCGTASAVPPARLLFGTVPPNDLCANATALSCGQTVTSSTFGSTNAGDPTGTVGGVTIFPASGGVFFRFTGTGTAITLSMCASAAEYDAELFVLRGTCGSYTLLAANDDGCNSAGSALSTLTFNSTYGQDYLAFVSGYSGDRGTFNLTMTCAPLTNLVVSSGRTASGAYNNVTITGPATGGAGTLTLAGPLQVIGALTVQDGGTLNTGCQALTGPGSFALTAGGTLGICDAAGIATSGASGAVQVAGTRSFSSDASYVYNGTAAQTTGSGLPAQVRSLSTTNANAVTLAASLSVARVLTVGGAGNLELNGQPLTLLSGSTGTALVVNSGTGIVSGSTATVQRYLDPSVNAGLGYRHYSAPVSGSTVADLTTAGFSPEISQASVYNASATPGTTTPFPTVFGYDQSRLAVVSSNYAAFDKGFFVPASPSTPLAVGQGYAVNLSAAQLVDFVGTLTTGTQTMSLARNTDATAADAGWQLAGNPYPAPLDFSQVAAADRPGLEASMYVFESSSQYAGAYRAYVNGVGGNPLIGTGQGFWVRVGAGQSSGALTFRNAQRLTSYADQVAVRRTAADARPLVQLELRGAGPADVLYAYAETGATENFDAQYDARKLPNTTGLNLASVARSGENLAIEGRAAFTTGTVLPLAVGVPAAGTYTLAAAALHNLPSGLVPYLTDAQTGQTIALANGASYAFSVTASQATAQLLGRFSLRFSSPAALATSPGLAAAQVSVYPNPAHGHFTVAVPGVADARLVQAELLNLLGQVVRRQTAALPATGTQLMIETANLAAGVYMLRLQAGATALTQRIVLR